MTAFFGLLNRTLTVSGFTATGEDGGGQPTGSFAQKGTVKGRVDPPVGFGRDSIEVENGSDLNPLISEFHAITALPVGFTIAERDTVADSTGSYEVLGVAQLDGRSVAHHLELRLRRVGA